MRGSAPATARRSSSRSTRRRLRCSSTSPRAIALPAEALEDSRTAARKMIETIEHPTVGALKMLGIPFKFSDTACSVRRPPPTLGQHSEEILSGELGLDDKAIADLRRQKVI